VGLPVEILFWKLCSESLVLKIRKDCSIKLPKNVILNSPSRKIKALFLKILVAAQSNCGSAGSKRLNVIVG